MSTADLSNVRTRLERRRSEILEAGRRTDAGIDQLRQAERQPELEETSQSEQLQHGLSLLGELEQRELARIDAALARLEAGGYGTCRECGKQIEARRLDALPFALECTGCAARREEEP